MFYLGIYGMHNLIILCNKLIAIEYTIIVYCDILYMEMMHMEIKTGYLYHIKDEYFDVVDDDSLMQNHEKGKKRPT